MLSFLTDWEEISRKVSKMNLVSNFKVMRTDKTWWKCHLSLQDVFITLPGNPSLFKKLSVLKFLEGLGANHPA